MLARRQLLALAGAGAAGAVLPSGPAAAAAAGGPAVPLPAPTGPLAVGTEALHLVDRRRRDPLVPGDRPRELMVQLWYPARRTRGRAPASYTTPRVAAALESGLPLAPGTLARVRPHARRGAPAVPRRLPLVLVGHGRKGGRSNLTALAEELASHGYLVAGVDHTHDAAVVEFPDGRARYSAIPGEPADWAAQERLEVAVRVGDLRCVADELTRRHPGARHPLRPLADPDRVGVLGHSMGGAAAAEALRVDRRFRAGAALDAGLFGSSVPDRGLDRPFLLLTALEDHETWQRWRQNQRGWARQLRIAGSGHLGYTDLPHFAAAGGLAEHWPPEVYAALLGTLDPARSAVLVRVHVRAFLDRFLRGRPAPLLDTPSPRYPEVEFRWSREAGAADRHGARIRQG
ncbi:alpha/beta hydrolase [Streptomyces sp. C10-9-1]|uniref:alpha/beta hydrolase family protein n=1 Tax=Streptomyces sp. C10-9-1 TaxID=1859285 RepID=UPI00211268A1|nr:alpha/beta hydrolase [Streptomyces sp. C10-9-1]MCQ6553237.1 alpha/beta hydrolase [Streptomyces sp. C10-9-1]